MKATKKSCPITPQIQHSEVHSVPHVKMKQHQQYNLDDVQKRGGDDVQKHETILF